MGTEADRLGRMMTEHVGGAIRALGYNLVTELYAKTPVDTTNARNNWVASVGHPSSIRFGSKAAPSMQALVQGVRQIARYRLVHGTLWVVNNVRYIGDLNAGTSRQAPAGYVQRAIEKVVHKIQILYGRMGQYGSSVKR